VNSKPSVVALGAMALIVLAGPALAQSIDLSPVQTLLLRTAVQKFATEVAG
jgi:type IV secretion system protein VirB2